MKTLILGATGFVGRALVLALQGHGHAVRVLARSPERAAALLPAAIDAIDFTDDAALDAAVADADAIVNLAGEPIAQRWTRKRKARLVASRVAVTERLVGAIARRSRPLDVFVCASATGWYGDRGDEILDEQSAAGDGFAAELCRAWEAAALAARATRVVRARFGIVLGREGGALQPLARVFGLGLGGRLGNGLQWMPWIHLDDAVRAIVRAIEDPRIAGALAVTAPEPVRQRDFARALGAALHRPAILGVPRAAIALALGEAASIVLASQRVVPQRLLANDFDFRFPTLDAALADLFDDGVTIERTTAIPVDATYLRERRPRYTLRATTELAAPLADVFAFFSAAANLSSLTPPGLAFEILGDGPSEMKRGALIDYKIRVARLPMRWRTRIERWSPAASFVDSQLRGPYRAWWHEHRFVEHDGKTTMDDIVHYAPPLGALGAIANRFVVAPMLRRIFGYRRHAIRLRFA